MKHINKLRKYDERLDNFSTWTASVCMCMCMHILSKMLRGLQMWCLYVGVWRWGGCTQKGVRDYTKICIKERERESIFTVSWNDISTDSNCLKTNTWHPINSFTLCPFSHLSSFHSIASLPNFILCLCPSSSLSPYQKVQNGFTE